MERPAPPGVCQLCQEKFTKNTITRHLQSCLPAHEPARGKEQRLFHLAIEGYDTYWLRVEMPGTRTFADLDRFLRDIWLECCGHLSLFLFEPERLRRLGVKDEWDFDEMPGEELMDYEIAEVLEPKLAFGYEYDMGSTTDLQLRVVDVRVGKWASKARVRLLARNLPPKIPCEQCGKPARWCDTESNSFLCATCGKKASDEFRLPVVNSPRVGVCGYTGED
jgi:hypothetical protein